MSKHTPGPWACLPQNGAGPMIVHEFETGNQMNPTGYRLIAHMLQRKDSLEQDRANAAVIAAAPELLEALASIEAKAMAMANDPEQSNRGLWRGCADEARAAIAKATP